MHPAPRPADDPGRHRDDRGLSMVVTLVGLVVVALLVLVGVKTLAGSSSTPSGGSSGSPVASADDGRAQASLATALTTAATSAAGTGTYVGLDAASLGAAEPSLSFVAGSSTGPGTVSVATTSGGSGSITLAARSSGGTCWYAWRSPQAGTWYGAETGGGTCAAQPIEPTPNPGTVSDTSIGWQQGSFPTP